MRALNPIWRGLQGLGGTTPADAAIAESDDEEPNEAAAAAPPPPWYDAEAADR